jgi:hypothetical protein
VTAAVASVLFAAAVVAFSFAQYDVDESITWAQDMPFGIGLPVLATGLGLLAAACVRAVAVNAVEASPS